MVQMRSYDDVEMALSTLAAGAVIKGQLKIDGSREQGIRLSKMKAACSISGKTTGEGPIIVGLCNTDLSVTEVAEAFAADPQKELDTPASEQVMREVFPIWHFGKGVLTGQGDAQPYREVRYPWKDVIEGNGLSWFAINLDSGSLTTGTLVDVSSVTIGEWRED